MRVLFATWAAPGHLYPMVPLAWACQASGMQVRVAVPPNCQEGVHRAGLTAVAVGPGLPVEPQGRVGSARTWGSDRPWPAGWTTRPELLDDLQTMVLDFVAGKQVGNAATMVDDLVAFCRWWRPDLLVCDALCFAGPVAAAAVGIPHVATGWALGTILRAERVGRAQTWLPGYAELFERFGAGPRGCADHFIESAPSSLRIGESRAVQRIEARYVPYNGGGAIPHCLAERGCRPRLCVTWGVALGSYAPAVAGAALQSLVASVAGLGLDVVIAAGRDLAGRLAAGSPGTLVAEGVPMDLLLPTCAAVIHHGGASTAMTAVAAGVPQLVLPQSPLYSEVGHRIHQAGAGLVVDADSPTEYISTALAELLEDERFAKSLSAIQAEMAAMPSPAEVVPELATLAGARSATRRPGPTTTAEEITT